MSGLRRGQEGVTSAIPSQSAKGYHSTGGNILCHS